MSFANATSGIHGHFYYGNLGDNIINCKIKGLWEIPKCGIFISVFTKNGVICRHIVPLKQNKVFPLFITFTLRETSFLVSLVPPIRRSK